MKERQAEEKRTEKRRRQEKKREKRGIKMAPSSTRKLGLREGGYAKKPDTAQFQKKVAVVQSNIDRLTLQMKNVQKKADEHRGKKGVAKGPAGEARQAMRELREKKNGIMDRRKALFAQRDAFKTGMDAMKTQ